ncbi:MAG: protein kinase [Woeseiaceae bacterium]
MNANSDNLKRPYAEDFSELETRLQSQVDDETVLAEIHVALRGLLSNSGDSESRIHEILQKRYAAGELRPESVELVQKMLDRIRSNGASTLPVDNDPAPQEEVSHADTEVIVDAEPFVATTVIADDVPVEITTAEQIQVGSVLRDRFLLQEQVLGGGTGIVYKALDQRLADAGEADTHVAIKVLPSELSRNDNALRALQQEVAKGRCLAHPNIVRFIDLDREGEMNFIVMEWLEGKSLTSILEESDSKKIDLETTLDIIKQVSLALDYAHQRGVVHGDINPGNVRITPAGEVKLFDFGVARILQKEQDAQPDFDPRELGSKSPEYSSMQVLTGEDPVPADDVFSLACLMYRLIAGYRVFGPRSAAEAASEGMEPQQPPGLSDSQWLALKKALAYSRVPRFSSPAEFLAAFGKLPKSQPVQSAEPVQPAPPEPQAQPAQLAQAAPPMQPAPPEPQAQPAPSVEPVQPAPPEPQAQPAPPAQPVQPAPPEPQAQPAPQAQPVQPAPPEPQAQPVPLVVPDEPMVARNFDLEPRRSPWRLVVLGIILIASVAVVTQKDILERVDQLVPIVTSIITDEIIVESPPVSAAETVAAPATEAIVEDAAAEDLAEDTLAEVAVESTATESSVDEGPPEEAVAESTATETADEPEIDFTALLPPTLTIGLTPTGRSVAEVDLTLREDSDPATIDLVRMKNMLESYSVLLEEVGFSGNRSPWEEGQYEIANDGLVTFEAGQNRARTTISMLPDTLRETDREVTILVREADNAESELARINLQLEDDDRRVFEAGLPRNTIAFTDSQVLVREADHAVQIDVVRFKPDNTSVEVSYAVRDVTATAGEDYFPPGLPIIYFAPGQRSAHILIPLVQDSAPELGEVFMLELLNDAPQTDPDVHRRISILIQDDD